MNKRGQEPGGISVLAEAIKARMEYLDLPILEVGDRGGPQRGAMREILNARRVPRRSTLSELDTVLGWPKGLAQEILDGTTPPPQPDEWPYLPDENRLGLVRSQLVQMRKDNLRMSQALAEQSDTISELLGLIDQERQ